MKTEPAVFSLEDLEMCAGKTEPWDGVRNYQARNYMRDQMRIGDRVLFYHSNCKAPGIVGIACVASSAYVDPTQFDPRHLHYDGASTRENPRWVMVDVKFERRLNRLISLTELRRHAASLNGLLLLSQGNRLSVMPVHPKHWQYILTLE